MIPAGRFSPSRRWSDCRVNSARRSWVERAVQQRAVGEGREAELAAELEFLLGVAVEVVVAGELDGGRVGGEGLDDHLALEFAAAGASGDLGEQLEGALAGAEIGDVERRGRR